MPHLAMWLKSDQSGWRQIVSDALTFFVLFFWRGRVRATCAATSRWDRCIKNAPKGVSESEEHLVEYPERKMGKDA
jgi:hypothetical protein